MRKKKRSYKSLILLLIIIVVIVGAIVFFYFYMSSDQIIDYLNNDEIISFLFIFSENEKPLAFEVFIYHPVTNKGTIIYVPGNIGQYIETINRYDRLDYLYDLKDLNPLRAKIENLLNIKIPFYLDISTDYIPKLVDLMEGIDLLISRPVDMVYNGKRILLQPGSIILDGDKAKDYMVHKREDDSIAEIADRQLEFLRSILKKISQIEINELILKGRPFSYFYELLRTNLSARSIKTFLSEMKNLKPDRIILKRVRGRIDIVDQGNVLIFPHNDGELLRLMIQQTLESIASQEITDEQDINLSIEILNGTNKTGLARRTQTLFESYGGFDVINIGNADNDQYFNTVVIDRKGKIDIAKRVADIIQCKRIYTKIDEDAANTLADVTIILGRDFDGKYCKSP